MVSYDCQYMQFFFCFVEYYKIIKQIAKLILLCHQAFQFVCVYTEKQEKGEIYSLFFAVILAFKFLVRGMIKLIFFFNLTVNVYRAYLLEAGCQE